MKVFASLIVFVAVSGIISLASGEPLRAVCYMEPNRQPSPGVSEKVTGKITLIQPDTKGPIQISVRLKGVTPFSVHGFHVHTSGDIISKGCQSCGSHFRSDGTPHGGPRDTVRHIGDLGNVMSDTNGDITTDFIDYKVTLTGEDSVMGRSIVIHEKRDDLGRGEGADRKESLKTGNAGARLACCAIVH